MKCLCTWALVGAALLAGISSSYAAPTSRNNPYRSFNITGINYGAQQWERAHHGPMSRHHHSFGLFRHR
jgi:hypothetical protein